MYCLTTQAVKEVFLAPFGAFEGPRGCIYDPKHFEMNEIDPLGMLN